MTEQINSPKRAGRPLRPTAEDEHEVTGITMEQKSCRWLRCVRVSAAAALAERNFLLSWLWSSFLVP